MATGVPLQTPTTNGVPIAGWGNGTAVSVDPQAAPVTNPTASINGSTNVLQGSTTPVQTTASPTGLVDPTANATIPTTVDPGAAGAGANTGALRDQITALVNSVKDIFNSRYGQVDASAAEQAGKLNTRFGNESSDLAHQITNENDKVGASYAGRGAFDSSYRGNANDTVTNAGTTQTRDLGTELADNLAKIAAWVSQQKTTLDANKGAADTTLARANDTNTSATGLESLRNGLDSQISTLQAGNADNNTAAQNASSLEAVAPSSARGVQLKTTLSQILAGNADTTQKAAIGHQLITSANLSPEDQQKLAQAFQAGLSGSSTTPVQNPTA